MFWALVCLVGWKCDIFCLHTNSFKWMTLFSASVVYLNKLCSCLPVWIVELSNYRCVPESFLEQMSSCSPSEPKNYCDIAAGTCYHRFFLPIRNDSCDIILCVDDRFFLILSQLRLGWLWLSTCERNWRSLNLSYEHCYGHYILWDDRSSRFIKKMSFQLTQLESQFP